MDEVDILLKNRYSEGELIKLATKLDKEFRVNYFWDGWKFLEDEVFSLEEIDYLRKKYKYSLWSCRRSTTFWSPSSY